MPSAEELTTSIGRFPADQPLIAVPIYNAYAHVVECVATLCATLPDQTPVLLIDDASSDPRIAAFLQSINDPRLLVISKPHNTGFVESVNIAIQIAQRRDVVLINSDVVVPPGWLERLQAAAYVRSKVATATPLSNNGAILSVPIRNTPQPGLPPGWSLTSADRAVQAASQHLYPIIPTGIGYCLYIRRSAIDIVGMFDTAFSPGYGEEVDFCQRAVGYGFCHVVADDLYVLHHGTQSFGHDQKKQLHQSHDALIAQRYPWYHPWVAEALHANNTALAECLGNARRALKIARVAIDATCLQAGVSGTETVTLSLTAALAALPDRDFALSVIITDPYQRDLLASHAHQIDSVVFMYALADGERFDLIIRPYQIYEPYQLGILRRSADRLIIFHLDSIRNTIPHYAKHVADWQEYRALTQLAFLQADGVAFISQDAAQEAKHAGLQLPLDRTTVVYLGLDHLNVSSIEQPQSTEALNGRPYLLMLGAAYQHKNRVLALHTLALLRETYGWDGGLIFAGPHPAYGNSVADEQRILREQPDLARHVLDLEAVSEAQKIALLKGASVVLYPSIIEGFGIVPFEAALAGTPALSTGNGSLGEVIGNAPFVIDSIDKTKVAEIVWQLINDAQAAERQRAWLCDRASQYTWHATAKQTIAFYRHLLQMPLRIREWSELDEYDLRMLIESSHARIPLPYAPLQPKSVQTMTRWRRYATSLLRMLRLAGPLVVARALYRRMKWRVTSH